MKKLLGGKEEKENCRNTVSLGICDGNCQGHEGEPKLVRVKTKSGYDWGYFSYCETAIEEDRFRGFIVTVCK